MADCYRRGFMGPGVGLAGWGMRPLRAAPRSHHGLLHEYYRDRKHRLSGKCPKIPEISENPW